MVESGRRILARPGSGPDCQSGSAARPLVAPALARLARASGLASVTALSPTVALVLSLALLAPAAVAAPAALTPELVPQTNAVASSTDPTSSTPEAPLPLRYVLEGIAISGNERTRRPVILRFLPFKRGDVLNVDDPRLELTRYRLLGTGFFRDVTLSLQKGSMRGNVVLHVNVVERNTIVVNNVWMGLSASADTRGENSHVSSFGGVDVAETNLFGSGITLGVATAFSADQQAYALRFLEPSFMNGPWMLDAEAYHHDGLGFFGNANVRWDDPSQLDEVRRQAVVGYRRRGIALGVGRDLSVSTQVWAHYRFDHLHSSPPRAASHDYFGETEPLQFGVLKGDSLQSTLRLSLSHDTRDQPVLPTRGWNLTASLEVGLRPIVSDYAYQRIDLRLAQYWPLAHDHVVSVSAFVGAISGDAPFIDQYYIGDLSDFRPGRVLGLAFDDRPAPNFLGTSIAETRYGDYAAKLVGEYRIPLYRGRRSVYGVDLFVSGGVFGLSSQRQLDRPPRNKHGAALVPVDLTATAGVWLDTSLGGFSLSISNLIGFAPLGQEGAR